MYCNLVINYFTYGAQLYTKETTSIIFKEKELHTLRNIFFIQTTHYFQRSNKLQNLIYW